MSYRFTPPEGRDSQTLPQVLARRVESLIVLGEMPNQWPDAFARLLRERGLTPATWDREAAGIRLRR